MWKVMLRWSWAPDLRETFASLIRHLRRGIRAARHEIATLPLSLAGSKRFPHVGGPSFKSGGGRGEGIILLLSLPLFIIMSLPINISIWASTNWSFCLSINLSFYLPCARMARQRSPIVGN